MIAFALLYGIMILMVGNTIAAIQGEWAQQLELPGASMIPYLPWTALGIYAIAVFIIRRIPTTWNRWTAFFAITITMCLVVCYPILVLNHGSERIHVDDFLTSESKASLKAKYPIKWVSIEGPGGTWVLVRRTDYSDELAHFISLLATGQSEQDSLPQPPQGPAVEK